MSKKKRWNVLVCLAGDNNLTEEMVWSLQEMKKASSRKAVHDSLNLVALFDPPGENPRRYDIVVGDEKPEDEDDGGLAALTKKEFEYEEDEILAILRDQVAGECIESLQLDEAKKARLAEALRNYAPVAAHSTATTLDAERDASALAKVARLLEPQLGARLRFVSRNNTVSALVNRFLLDQVDRLPASDNYAIILSGHGSGAVGDFLTDNDPKSAVSIPKLRKVLCGVVSHLQGKKHDKIQILGMDSCQMSTIEVAYEMQDLVEYMVASEGAVLNTGWPYHRVLHAFAPPAGGGNQHSVEDAAQDIAYNYSRFYRDYEVGGVSTDIAVCSVGRIGRPATEPEEGKPADYETKNSRGTLAYWVQALATAMLDALGHLAPDGMEEAVELGLLKRSDGGTDEVHAREIRNAIVAAHSSAQPYKGGRYVDLYDFCAQLRRFCPTVPKPGRRRDDQRRAGDWSEVVQNACEKILTAIKSDKSAEDVVIKSCYTGYEFQHSHGLSIYFPWSASDYLPDYRNLRFAQHTRWAEFLETYLKVTVRMRRDQGKRVKVVAPEKQPFGITTPEDKSHTVIAEDPIRRARTSLLAAETLEGTKDPDAGTPRDPDAGTPRGQVSFNMRNPPDGYYEDRQVNRRKRRPR